ncbi:thioredoxin-dependent thiol peroxidase [[Pseudomonas] carboxydohydrogena]|nr:thioredoxin-dependent thiol peroxidase [[Pseudomonas] carboxydohydrogena]
MTKKTNKKTSKKTVRKAATKAVTKAVTKAAAAKKSRTTASTGPATTGPAHTLNEGMAAPAFRLSRDDGGNVSLKDFAGHNLVLYFYPRANTPGCTLEAADFTRLSPRFEALDTAILGVSADSQAALQRFRKKHDLNIALASDETLAMLKAYGVWGKKTFMGRTFDGILRTTVWIGPKGRIARIWRNVKVPGHAEAVFDAIREAFS